MELEDYETTNDAQVLYKDDTKIANAGTFIIKNHDHTIGNLLKTELLSDKKNVLFSGYKKPHPLENNIKVKVQTIDEKHPIDVLKESIGRLRTFNQKLRDEFEEEMKARVNQLIDNISNLKHVDNRIK